MSKKYRIFIGILLCITMVLTSAVSVMAAAGGTGEPGGLPAAEEASDENSGNGEGGTVPDEAEADDKADQNSGEAEKAKDAAGGKTSVEPAGKKSAAKGLSLKAVPGDNVTSEVQMNNGESKSGDFTIGTDGVVVGPDSGEATISNCTVTNNAKNDKKGQYSDSNGSAFIARGADSLKFDNTTINSEANTLVFNIWANSSITANSVTLSGSANSANTVPFLMVGAYPNGDAGTLTFSGESAINGAKGSIIGGNNNSVININDGTLKIENADINIRNGIKIIVKNGATLEIKNSKITQSDRTNTAGIIVEPGGTLNISGSDLVDTWIRNNEEGTVNITGTESDKSDLDNCVIKNLNSTLNISNSRLHNCKRRTAPNAEGGFDTMIHGTGATITLTNTEICNNTNTYETPSSEAVPGASIISVKDGSVTMKNVYAHDNVVSTNGGVMHAVDADVTISDNSIFTNNSADNQGWRPGDWYGKGGALFIEDDHINPTPHKTIINNTTFEGNKATEGGAVFIKSDNTNFLKSMIYMTDSTFTKNKAPRAGGGLVIWGNGTTADLRGVVFNENTAGNFGGGMAVFFDKDPNGTLIRESDNGPSKFVKNTVTEGKNFAGGGLFIDQAHVTMYDTAIYKNTAPHAGGGLSTCGVGTLEARVHDGVAIFDNNVSVKHGSLPDGKTLKDVYLRNIDNNANLPGDQKDFPDYPYELYERMFNGGLHNWDKKEIKDGEYLQLVAKSDATNTDVSKAKVIFTENIVTATGNEVVSGGGIACNGLLTIGRGTELKAVKIWDDNNNNDGYRPDPNDEIDWIKIKADGEEIDLKEYNVEFTIVKGSEADDYVLDNNIAVIDEDGKVTKFSEKYKDLGDNAWLIIIDGDFPRYRDVEKEGGGITHEPIKYTVEEDLTKLGNKYTKSESKGDMDSYFELTNSHVDETVEVAGQKTWDDNNNQRGDRPESITVTLFKNGVQVPDAVKTIGESNNWKWDFGEFPKFENGKKISYTVVENAVSDYSVSYNDFNVTNKYTPGMTSVTVVKNWEDKDDADGIRPSSVTVKLLANGKDTGKTLVLSKSNNWIGAFTDLYEKENGKAIVYTVSETAVKGYTSSVSGDQKTGYVITNKHNPKKGVRTGDANNVLPWIITLAAAAAILGAVIAKRRLNK